MADTLSTTQTANTPDEKPWRSLAKAFTWRAVGTFDTFLLSLAVIYFLGPAFGMQMPSSETHMATVAGYIAATEVITKILIYCAHERIWAKITWGISNRNGKRHESYPRTSAKTAAWRVVASLDTMVLAWFFTGNLMTAFSIGSLEVLTKLILYFLHERLWNRIPLGIQ